jgi:hypothetical protein
MGLYIGDDTLWALHFTDHQIVIAKDKDNLSYMVRKLQEACGVWAYICAVEGGKLLIVRTALIEVN